MWNVCKLKMTTFLLLSFCWVHVATAGNWKPPVDLSAEGQDAVTPQIVVDQNGLCTAIWSRHDGTNYVVQSSQAQMNGEWSSPVNISKPVGNALFPHVVLDSKNRPVVVWVQNHGATTVIQASIFHENNWKNPLTISGEGTELMKAAKPKLAVESNGTVVATWQKNNGTNNIIQVARKPKNYPWEAAVDITSAVTQGIGDIEPQIAADQKGNIVVAWIHDATNTVQASIRKSDGTWLDVVNLSDGTANVYMPRTAYDNEGRPIVVWTTSLNDDRVIQSITRKTYGVWTPIMTLSAPGGDASNAQLVVDTGGSVFIAWERSDGENTVVQNVIREAKNNISSWLPVSNLSLVGQDASDVKLSTNQDNTVVAVWKRSDGANFIIQSAYKTHGHAWSKPLSISDSGEDAVRPQIAIDQMGNFVTVWDRTDGQNTIIQAAYRIVKK